MNDSAEKESARTTDNDKFMTITKFAWDEKVEHVRNLKQQNKRLKEALEQAKYHLSRDSYIFAEDAIDAALNERPHLLESKVDA